MNIKRYVVPAGTVTAPSPLEEVLLQKNDTVRIVEAPEGSSYVKVQITGLFRTVEYKWLDDKNEKILCEYLGENASWYLPKELDDLNSVLNGWVTAADKLYYRSRKGRTKRDVLFPCGHVAKAQVWVTKDILGEKNDRGNSSITRDTVAVYAVNPGSSGGGNSTSSVVTVDNPEVLTLDGKTLIRLDQGTLVEMGDLEPQTPFGWAGFELMSEEPPNYDAFMDFGKIASSLIVKKGVHQETNTGKEFEAAIKAGTNRYDIGKVYTKKEWKERIERLIVKVPSEWHYSDEKYAALSENIGNLDPEKIKSFIKTLAFWDDCKVKKVFDATLPATTFSDKAKEGKEIWCFHPIAFIRQMSQLMKAGLTPEQKSDFDAFVNIVRAAAGDNYGDPASCKAIAASFAYRLKKHEWSDASTFHELATRHNLPMQRPTDEEFLKMAEHIGRIFLEKNWSGLSREYVFFHSASAALSAQPWDAEVLDTENRKSVGAFTFYRYKADAKFHATILIVKEIKLVAGGDKGTSLPCAPGEPLSVSNEGAVRPYRYDLQSTPKWDFEFRFNIQSGTPEIEDLKKALEWELRYTRKNNESFEKIKIPVTHSANRFSLTIPAEVYGYSVELVPMVDDGIALCSEFTIAIRKQEQLLFNGKVIKWLSETGAVVPFDDNGKQIEEIAAYSGNAGKREKEHASVQNEGPVPEGVWWVARNNLQSYERLAWWEQTLDKFLYKKWPGGEKRWGNYRIWMEADKDTDKKGREELSICGGETELGGGDIHLKDGIGLFVRNFISRVKDGGRLMLRVDYSQKKTRILGRLSSKYETGGRGSITVSTGVGDKGGVSYGAYQMTSRPDGGRVTEFVRSPDFPWKAAFEGLTAGTSEFSEKWKSIVTSNKDEFINIEHEFIMRTHYNVLIGKIKKENGIDLTSHSDVLNDVIWSTSVQHGPDNDIVGIAIGNVKSPQSKTKEYDKDLIKEIYAERGRKRNDGILAHFSRNSIEVQQGVSKRYQGELPKALEELENENY